MTSALELRHYGHDDLPEIRQTLIDVHADVHADRMADGEFRQKFPWFVDHWGGNPGFSCVIAYDGDEVVGFSFGAPAMEGREWWRKRLAPAPEKPRTFHFSELMVRERWRKTGTAERLHRALMAARDEGRRHSWWTWPTRRWRRCTSRGGTGRSGRISRSRTPRCSP